MLTGREFRLACSLVRTNERTDSDEIYRTSTFEIKYATYVTMFWMDTNQPTYTLVEKEEKEMLMLKMKKKIKFI